MTPGQRIAAQRAGTLLSRYGMGSAAAERFALRAAQTLRTGSMLRAARAVAAVMRVFNDCLARQAQLVGLYRENALKLRADADGRLVYGEFCDSVVSGPDAWPAAGASIDPPARGLEVKPCTERSGLVQRCG